VTELRDRIDGEPLPAAARDGALLAHLLADLQYAGYVDRQRREIDRLAAAESVALPRDLDYHAITGLRAEAAQRLTRHRPETLGQARRLEGVNPADLLLVSVALRRHEAAAT